MAEECNRVEAVRLPVRTEMDELRQAVSETRKARAVSVYVQKGQRSAVLDRVERAVAMLFGSNAQSLRSGPEGVVRSEVAARSL